MTCKSLPVDGSVAKRSRAARLDVRSHHSRRTLTKHFGTRSLEGFGFETGEKSDGTRPHFGRRSRAQLPSRNAKGVARAHRPPKPVLMRRTTAIDPATRRSLEIVATLRDGRREGSLLGGLDRTVTCLGARLLADWLAAPLTDVVEINARLDAVAELVSDANTCTQLRETLRRSTNSAAAGSRNDRPGFAARLGIPRQHAGLSAEDQGQANQPREPPPSANWKGASTCVPISAPRSSKRWSTTAPSPPAMANSSAPAIGPKSTSTASSWPAANSGWLNTRPTNASAPALRA